MNKNKRVLLIFLIIVGLFFAYNIFWLLSVHCRYKDYLEAVPEEYGAHIQFDEEDHLSYNVKTPDYLQRTGNLGVADNEGIALIIWPPLYGNKFEYGVRIQDSTGGYEIIINEKLESVSGNPDDEMIVEKYYSEIKNLYDKAKIKFKKVS